MTYDLTTPQRPSAAPAYADVLPQWLRYLVAAYPAARLASTTFAVFEDAFSEYEPAVLAEAAKAAVRDNKWFPSVAEFGGHVRRAAEEAEMRAIRGLSIEEYRLMSTRWPTCPECGERQDPVWSTCPACADLARNDRTVCRDCGEPLDADGRCEYWREHAAVAVAT